MDALIARLKELNIDDPAGVAADCVDFGRLPLLMDYMSAREALHGMEVETYVR